MNRRGLIIDDEPLATRGLTTQLARMAPWVEVVGSAPAIDEAYRLIRRTAPDLIFLDIMLVDGTGFKLLERFERPDFHIIFTTAYDNHAVQAFRFAAIDYLLKPISAEELMGALGRLPEDEVAVQAERVERMVRNQSVAAEHRKMAIPEANGIEFVRIGDILRIAAESNHSRVTLVGGREILSTRSLKGYEELLESVGFFRGHKSFLINLRHIERYNRGKQPTAEISDGKVVPLARRAPGIAP